MVYRVRVSECVLLAWHNISRRRKIRTAHGIFEYYTVFVPLFSAVVVLYSKCMYYDARRWQQQTTNNGNKQRTATHHTNAEEETSCSTSATASSCCCDSRQHGVYYVIHKSMYIMMHSLLNSLVVTKVVLVYMYTNKMYSMKMYKRVLYTTAVVPALLLFIHDESLIIFLLTTNNIQLLK